MFNKAYGYILKHPATKRGSWGHWYYRRRYEQVLMRLSRFYQKDSIIILELGCGSGVYASYLGKANCRCHYVGCDIERRSLRVACRSKKIDYVLCDIRQLPFVPRCADVILCSEVLEHVSAPYSTLASICELDAEILIITFPEESLLLLLGDRHPEHISTIDKEEIMRILVSKKLKVMFGSQIFSSFVPCGILEFLSAPQNDLTRTAVDCLDRFLKKVIPCSLVPHRTILIEASRAGSNKLLRQDHG